MRIVESTRERVVTRLAQLEQPRREILFAALFLILLLLTGMFGYRLIEGWSLMDGLYMTFITLSTIGFGEVRTLTTAGRLFTIFIGISGIGIVAFVAARSAQLLLTSERLRQRQIRRKIERMENHFIICGYGRIGKRVVEDLLHADKEFVIVDLDPDEVAAAQDAGLPALQGDAEDENVLKEAGLDHAQGLILLLPEDSDNVFATLVARDLRPDLFVLARTNDVKNRRKLMQAGANKVIAPLDVGADRISQVVLRPNVDQFMERVLRTTSLGLQMEEVDVEPDAPLAGKSLSDSNFRQQFDAIVIAIIEGETEEMKFNPGPHDRITAGDTLVVLGSEEMIDRLRVRGCTAC
ncbi:MAG: potassium channel protein [Bacteroidetes bacterium]|jgi:voltage-gated potassium channel|nr:potassium channel protein [Bacteroidota bacterium]